MGYSFKEDVIARLPEGHTLVRMYSSGEDQTSIETNLNGVKNVFVMQKVDLSTYFLKMPTISLERDKTYNDLYEKISDLYGLGLQRNVDFYNDTPLPVTTSASYVELPLSSNSFGYKGLIRCFVVLCQFTGIGNSILKDISQEDMKLALYRLQFRNYLSGNLFQVESPMFVENHLSEGLINQIASQLDWQIVEGASDLFRQDLIGSKVVDCFNDGISDIAILSTPDRELYHLRFKSLPDDLPVIKNDESDVKIDDSQELPIGEGENEYNSEQSELPHSSTGGELEDSDMEIEIG